MMTEEKIVEYVIGYKPEIFKKDEVLFEIIDESSIRINYCGMIRDFFVEFEEWFPIEWKDDYEESFYIPFSTQDLMRFFKSFADINECTECEGNGYVESDISHRCTTRMSDCCGGCTAKIECECDNNQRIFTY